MRNRLIVDIFFENLRLWLIGQVSSPYGCLLLASDSISPLLFFSNRRPQPDNREGRETCLGVLNGVYNDGIKFHDISCHHRKPVICEA